MKRLSATLAVSVTLAASLLLAQETKAPAAMAFDKDACVKHCQEMAQAHQEMMNARKAMMERQDQAWKEIRAQIDAAKKLRGEKKVAALESALDKLVAFHESMQKDMGGMMGGPMGHGRMGHGKMMMGHPMMGGPMMGMMGCCGGMMGCCGGMGMGMNCPMMTGGTPAEGTPKPEN
jgi:hypothetical protein